MRQFFLILATFWLVACAGGSPVPTRTLAPTPQSAPTESAPTAGLALQEFVTPEGYHALGSPDAPGTIVMYSDVF